MSGVGILLLLLTGALAYIGFNSKPEETSKSLKAALYLCLVFGLIFSAAGPSLALYRPEQSIQPKSEDDVRQRLINNARVRYVVRLIAYKPDDKDALSLEKIQKLGPQKQLYSFVADYEELKGHTVAEALDMIGTGYNGFDHVSAIIFPLYTRIYPANARGLLQVISKVEDQLNPKDRFIQPETFNRGELDDLKNTSINSYPIKSPPLENLYPHYCQVARTYFCANYPSRDLIGGLYRDWHPLGFSQRDPPNDPCSIDPNQFCAFSGWDKFRKDFKNHFGTRAFLIENLDVNRISGRIMIDSTDPQRDKIPEIGLPPPK